MNTIDSQEMQLPSEIISALQNGSTYAISQKEGLLAFLVPAHPAQTARPSGLAKGQIVIAPDFNDPLPDYEEATYNS